MGKDLVDLTFSRSSTDEPWGFRLSGGKDYGQPLTISQVTDHQDDHDDHDDHEVWEIDNLDKSETI